MSALEIDALEYAVRAAADAADWERVARYSARLQDLEAADLGGAKVIDLEDRRLKR